MTDYDKLVAALRYCEFGWSARTCDNCEYSKTDCQLLLSDAADAIEALQATIELMKPYMPDFFPDANKVTLPKMEVQDADN